MTRKETRASTAGPASAAHFALATRVEVWGANATLAPRAATLELAAFDLADPEWTDVSRTAVVLAPNAATELWAGPLPGQPPRTRLSDVPRTIVLSARLLDEDGTVLARYANW